MTLTIALLILAGVAFLAALALAVWDFVVFTRTRQREARAFARRRTFRPWHLVTTSLLGDPAYCWSPNHNHAPEDFSVRFRNRPSAMARIRGLVLALAVLVLALLGAIVTWFITLAQ